MNSDSTLATTFDAASLRRQYVADGFFVLPGIIPPDHLTLLRRVCTEAIAGMDAEMDRQNTTVLGINHKGKRYFVGQA